jgi:hypothetical protein
MNPVSIVVNGTTFTGEYSVSGEVLTVIYNGKSKRTQLGGMNPDNLAKQLLAEISKR